MSNSNTTMEQPKKNGFFSNLANPVLRKLERNGEYASSNAATYKGIVIKTIFFLAITIIGVALSLVLHNLMISSPTATLAHVADSKNGIYDLTVAGGELVIMIVVVAISIITPFIAWLVRPAIPVVGSLYSLAQGMLIGYITIALAQEYKYISLFAMLLTLALVGGMLLVYAKRIIKVTARFRGVITAIFFGIIVSGIIYFLLSLIPAVRNSGLFTGISTAFGNPIVSVIIGIVYVILAALFMLVDFDTIERCVTNQVDEKYEWMAAWGLAYTILYIYFKILRILLTILGNRSSRN
ncbi:MAG: Bax inhibitor-1/YccA family protein [Lachnospiraceae bacterium]|nr:Bax inhibitor-1/YccA family protein [Lachnospiraceae bacterium]